MTGSTSDLYVDPVTLTRKVRTFLGPGPAEVIYEATVDVDATGFDPAQVLEFDFAQLPMEYLEYLAASRYCPSDTFTKLAFETFGTLPRGHTRVTAICDWMPKRFAISAGSGGAVSAPKHTGPFDARTRLKRSAMSVVTPCFARSGAAFISPS